MCSNKICCQLSSVYNVSDYDDAVHASGLRRHAAPSGNVRRRTLSCVALRRRIRCERGISPFIPRLHDTTVCPTKFRGDSTCPFGIIANLFFCLKMHIHASKMFCGI